MVEKQQENINVYSEKGGMWGTASQQIFCIWSWLLLQSPAGQCARFPASASQAALLLLSGPHFDLWGFFVISFLPWPNALLLVSICRPVRLGFPSVQFSSVTQSCPTLWDPMNCSTPGLPVQHQLPEFTQTPAIESVMPSSHLIFCCPLFLLPPIPASIRVFSSESALHVR